MIFNVRLRQSRVYDTAVEADTAEQAVQLARKASRHDPANWLLKVLSARSALNRLLTKCCLIAARPSWTN